MKRAMIILLGLVAITPLQLYADEKPAQGVGAKIENLGKKLRSTGDKVVAKTTKALKHAGKKTRQGVDKAGNATSDAVNSAAGRK